MSGDDWLFGQPTDAAPATSPAPATPAGSPALWTVLGEAGGDLEGQRAVASTIVNRQSAMKYGTPDEVVADPHNGYQPWQEKAADLQKQYPVGSPAYKAAQAAVGDILAGKSPAPYDYTHFHAGTMKTPPAWDDGTGVNIGGNLFFKQNLTPPANLTPFEQSQWEALQEGGGTKQDVRLTPTATTPEPGSPADPQANAVRFLESQGFRDTAAPKGSSTNPLAETEASGAPDKLGTYYIDRGGALRSVGPDGKPGGDFLPYYQSLASQRAQASAQPIATRLGAGAVQGVSDVAASVNRMTGGGLAAGEQSPMGSALRDVTFGPNSTQQFANAATQGATDQRNAFDMLRSPDAAATAGRIVGQGATIAPFMAAGEGAVGLGADALAGVLPRTAPAIDFLTGNATGNLAMRAASRAVPSALQGAAAGAMTSATSDESVGSSAIKGAEFGAAAGAAAPIAKAAGSAVARGVIGPEIPAPIAALADKAINTYKIPIRTLQIVGTVDRGAAYRDSEMIGQAATGFAKNNAEQRTAFTRAVSNTFGADSASLTPPVMNAARHDLGMKFDNFAAAHNITDADAVLTKLGAVVHDAQQSMPASEVAPLLKQVENIGSVIQPGATGAPGMISGKAYRALVSKGSPLDRAMQSGDSNLRYYAGQIKDALDDGIAQSATPEERAAFAQVRLQYKNLMTVKGLAAKSGVTGEISPALLQTIVNRSFDDRAFQGAGPLGELADIGQTFMKEPPQSGTKPRLMDAIKSHMVGLGLGGGAIGESLLMHDPAMAAKLGIGAAAATGARLTGEALSGAYNNNSLRTQIMLRGRNAVGVSPALRGVGVKLNELLGPQYAPASALAGVQLSRPQPTTP